jgi:Ca2+-binding EF-hand superfamily protein
LVFALAALWALLAPSAAASQLHFSVSAHEQAFLNALHAPEHGEQLNALRAAFGAVDADGDGQVSLAELEAAQRDGSISAADSTLMQAFDNDASGAVSEAEFTMAPYTLNLLQTEESVAAPQTRSWKMGAISIEMDQAASAFEGQHDGPVAAPARRLKSRAPVADMVMSELASRQIPANAAEGTHTKKASKRGSSPLPVSIFGVPSVADEECVMCQYFVQRIQAGVADRLDNGPGAAAAATPAGGAGLPGATAAAQEALKIRYTNSQLVKKPGGRGIVRVVAEDLVQALCAVDKMPLLFNPYCTALVEPNAINAVRKGIFFNMPTVEVCSHAALCRDDSYLNTNAAVHATKTSLFLNGQRGICGMLGGSKDRPDSRKDVLVTAICQAHGAVFGM